jgi:outer membrane protein assembly factor BamB
MFLSVQFATVHRSRESLSLTRAATLATHCVKLTLVIRANTPPLSLLLAVFASAICARGADRPQWGEAWSRNQVSNECGLPSTFDLATGANVRWRAPLGTETHSTPVISSGRVFIGTNNGNPRDARHQGDRGIFLCLDEKTGALRWQLVVPKLAEDRFFDWPNTGISSPATVEGDRVYLVSNRAEVLCLDIEGLANGNGGPFLDEARHQTPAGEDPIPTTDRDADILWRTDLREVAGIWPHDGAHSSPLIRGDHLYLNTGTGVDNSHVKIRTPDAAGLVVLDKESGRMLARDREGIALRIFHCTWSPPSMATVGGRELIFFAGGDGIVRAFEPLPPDAGAGGELKVVWRYDLDPSAPKEEVHRFNRNTKVGPSNIFGLPVFARGNLFVAGGGDLWWGKLGAWLKCVDASNGHERWSYALNKHVMSSPAVYEDMVFIADTGRTLHCVDAVTGRPLWTHEAKGDFWASPFVADGKVYIGTRKGDFYVFAATREKNLLHTADFGAPISATAVAANGTLFVATMRELFAIGLIKP